MKPRYFVAPLTPIGNSWMYVRDSECAELPNRDVWQMSTDLQSAEAMAIAACERFNIIDRFEKELVGLREQLQEQSDWIVKRRLEDGR